MDVCHLWVRRVRHSTYASHRRPQEANGVRDVSTATTKGRAAPLVRTPAQKKNASLAAAQTRAANQAQMLAQIVNLHIAGHSLADIGAAIGASAEEVDRLLTSETARYVKTQPALRIYVRNYISEKYTALLEGVWDQAVDKTHGEQLEHQDRAMRILDRMAKLHGAEAPTQSEVKVTESPENVERLVAAIAAAQGQGYDTNIFDVVPGTVVAQAHSESAAALEASSHEIEEGDSDDDL